MCPALRASVSVCCLVAQVVSQPKRCVPTNFPFSLLGRDPFPFPLRDYVFPFRFKIWDQLCRSRSK